MAGIKKVSIEGLSYDELTVLEVISFCLRSLNTQELTQLLVNSKIETVSGAPFKKEAVQLILEKLLKAKLISSVSKNSYIIDQSCIIEALQSFIKHHGDNKKILQAFIDLFKINKIYSYWFSEADLVNAYSRLTQSLLIGSDVAVTEALAIVRQYMRSDSSNGYRELFNFLNGKLIFRVFKFNLLHRVDKGWFNMIFADYADWIFINAEINHDLYEELLLPKEKLPVVELFISNYFFLQGRFDELKELADSSTLSSTIELYLWSRYLRGDDTSRAVELLLQKYAVHNKTKQEFVLNSYGSYWQVPMMLATDKSKLPKVSKFLKEAGIGKQFALLKNYIAFFKNFENPEGIRLFNNDTYSLSNSLVIDIWTALIYGICKYWIKGYNLHNSQVQLIKNYNTARESGAKYLQLEYAHLLAQIDSTSEYVKAAKVLKNELGVKRCISDIYTPPSDWELKLTMLADFANKADKKAAAPSEERLVWLINEKGNHIQPVLQKQLKNGSWSKGRNVSLAKLYAREVECVTPYDDQIIAKLVANNDYYGPDFHFHADAITALIGHPNLFFDKSPDVPIELEEEEIELIVDEVKDTCKFSLSHDIDKQRNTLIKYSTNKYKVVSVSPSIESIARIIGTGLTVPKNAKPRVLDTLRQLSGSVKINSPLIGAQTGATLVPASTRIFIHLLPLGSGIKADIYVKPLDPEPPYVRPADGLKKITGHSEAGHIFTERSFDAERESVQALMDACPVFASQAEEDNSALFADPAECLQVLSEFREAGDSITVEWPRGQKFSIKSKISLANFNIKVKKQNNWFDLQGDVTVDDEQVFSLVKMMELLDTAKNRFIEIEPGVFIELEKHFIRQLEYLKTVADVNTKQIKLHPLAAVTNASLFDSAASFSSDKEWKSFIANVRKTEKEEYPLPKGIEAELRPYQLEGYRWLRKMADWGTGACLADDMGLGKTLQCISLLVSRASQGPSLVIAPTSVCPNWIAEIEKFAPSLVPVLFGSTDRKNAVETIEAGGVLIVSYGLLATEAELLASRSWNVFILDEAHAIKNMATKRSQVAMSIEASFRIAATGTPLQNHMGELWNLFQFLNPGLLGSQQSFNERFVIPIEKSNNELARRSLKDLIKPFILRRTKNQVLHDLPEKTEITMAVELSPQERTFYEALRVKALEEIQKLDDTVNAGEKQMRVLAEIMKLRMACCHSTLANKDISIESSKLARFEELTEHLIENGHKALVFSQFIGHLSLMREMLDRKGIAYEYLDGSTAQKDREERIRKFQSGSADIFLISLKAGGVGLNLTAADYVIHMDPWWNPAVEDQASDRAHRIGQTKPVTIYRLVTKDTIEDKIVDLHKNKRDLADSLLEGTEGAAKVTADELIGLLRGL